MTPKSNTNPTKTIVILCIALLIFYLIYDIKWLIYIAIGLSLIAVISDYLTKKIDYLWMKLAWVLSFIVPNILLSIVFYLFLFPLSLLSKIFGKKETIQIKNPEETVYISLDKDFDKESFEKMW